MSIFLMLIVIYGMYLSINAMVLTGKAEAWIGVRNMVFLTIILVLCGIYIYLTHTQTVLTIIL